MCYKFLKTYAEMRSILYFGIVFKQMSHNFDNYLFILYFFSIYFCFYNLYIFGIIFFCIKKIILFTVFIRININQSGLITKFSDLLCLVSIVIIIYYAVYCKHTSIYTVLYICIIQSLSKEGDLFNRTSLKKYINMILYKKPCSTVFT